MSSEEIKKIAREYGESVVNRSDYDILPINPGEAYRQQVANETKQAESVLEWLSKDYCIVPKSKIKEHYKDVCENIEDYNGKGVWGIGCADMTMYQRARGMKQMIYRLFGKSFFGNEKGGNNA